MTMQTELNYKRIIKCINFSFKMRKMLGTQMASMLPNLVFQTVSMLPKHDLQTCLPNRVNTSKLSLPNVVNSPKLVLHMVSTILNLVCPFGSKFWTVLSTYFTIILK